MTKMFRLTVPPDITPMIRHKAIPNVKKSPGKWHFVAQKRTTVAVCGTFHTRSDWIERSTLGEIRKRFNAKDICAACWRFGNAEVEAEAEVQMSLF